MRLRLRLRTNPGLRAPATTLRSSRGTGRVGVDAYLSRCRHGRNVCEWKFRCECTCKSKQRAPKHTHTTTPTLPPRTACTRAPNDRRSRMMLITSTRSPSKKGGVCHPFHLIEGIRTSAHILGVRLAPIKMQHFGLSLARAWTMQTRSSSSKQFSRFDCTSRV